MKKFYVGVDIGGTKIRVVFADKTKFHLKLISPTVKTGEPDALVNEVISLIRKGMETLEIDPESIAGIGTSAAGPFVNGESISTPNICGFEGQNNWTVLPYLQVLRKEFGALIPHVLANDCVSSVKAENLFGAGQGVQNCVYITVSTGIGAGIISDGVLLLGKGGNAGHFGHMIIKKDGDLCGCGQRGCIESIASGRNITRRAQEAGLLYNGSVEFDTKEVFEMYHQGNAIAEKIIRETIEYLGIFLIDVINILDTELIIMGGSVFQNNIHDLHDPLAMYIEHNSLRAISEGVKIVPAELGGYVGDLAGLSLVFPADWVDQWLQSKPWKSGIENVLKFSLM